MHQTMGMIQQVLYLYKTHKAKKKKKLVCYPKVEFLSKFGWSIVRKAKITFLKIHPNIQNFSAFSHFPPKKTTNQRKMLIQF